MSSTVQVQVPVVLDPVSYRYTLPVVDFVLYLQVETAKRSKLTTDSTTSTVVRKASV